MIVLYVLLALFVFGVMILVHELGHFTFAKIFKSEEKWLKRRRLRLPV